MTIRIEFTGDDAQAIAQEILTVGFLIRGSVGTPKPAEPAEKVEAIEAEVIDPPKKPGRKSAAAKKAEIVEEAPAEADENPPDAETAAEKVETQDSPSSPQPSDTSRQESNQNGGAISASPSEPPMTIDELRKYTVGYLTFAHKKLDDQKAEFADLLGKFGVTKIGDLPEDKIAEMKALVDERKAKLEGEK